jgi:hypothetical protein
MQRTHLGRTVGVFAVCWGICVLTIAFCKDFKDLATVRFLQGTFLTTNLQTWCSRLGLTFCNS